MHLNEILSMGGYGLYVWTAYSITLLVFGINLFAALFEKKQVKKTLRQYFSQTHES
jgi:heme exporter protein CcmD